MGDENVQNSFERQGKDYKDLNKVSQFLYGKEFVDSLPWKPKDNVLDIGCGTGELAEYTARNKVPEGRVTAFDPDKQRIEIARLNFADVQNLSFHVGTALEFLKDKKDLYDLIYSNVVIHWFPIEERMRTFEAMYTAAKPGGIVSHLYGNVFPRFMDNIMPILTDDDRSVIHAMLHCIPTEEMDSLLAGSGFEVVSRDSIVHESKFQGGDDLLLWLEATYHGQVPFQKRFLEAKQKVEDVVKIEEDGSIIRRTDLVKIIMKKPEY